MREENTTGVKMVPVYVVKAPELLMSASGTSPRRVCQGEFFLARPGVFNGKNVHIQAFPTVFTNEKIAQCMAKSMEVPIHEEKEDTTQESLTKPTLYNGKTLDEAMKEDLFAFEDIIDMPEDAKLLGEVAESVTQSTESEKFQDLLVHNSLMVGQDGCDPQPNSGLEFENKLFGDVDNDIQKEEEEILELTEDMIIPNNIRWYCDTCERHFTLSTKLVDPEIDRPSCPNKDCEGNPLINEDENTELF